MILFRKFNIVHIHYSSNKAKLYIKSSLTGNRINEF